MNIFKKMRLLSLIREFKAEKVGKSKDVPRFGFFDDKVSLVEKWIGEDILNWLKKGEDF